METEASQGTASEAVTEDADALGTKLAEANARADENHAKLLYALADFENYRKRNERHLEERLSAGRRAIIGKFLPVLDNLQRALAFERDTDGLRDGLAATQRGFEALLAAEDVKPLQTVGMPFDPRVAEAIGTRESSEAEENTVLEEVQRGYTLGDELLRPARVIVAQRPAGEPSGAANGAEAAPY